MNHGHVTPNASGLKVRCGGPAICSECALELAAKNRKESAPVASTGDVYSGNPAAHDRSIDELIKCYADSFDHELSPDERCIKALAREVRRYRESLPKCSATTIDKNKITYHAMNAFDAKVEGTFDAHEGRVRAWHWFEQGAQWLASECANGLNLSDGHESGKDAK